MASIKYVQAKTTTLYTNINTSVTSIILNGLYDVYGNALSMSDFGDIGYGTIEPLSRTNQEIISFTGITDNGDGTVTLTGVTRGLKATSAYVSGGTARSHDGNVKFIISNNPQYWNSFMDLYNDQTVEGKKTFSEVPASSEDASSSNDLIRYSQLQSAVLGTLVLTGLVTPGNAGETVASRDFIYLDDTDSEWKKADADSASTSENKLLGIALGAGTDGNAIANGVHLQGKLAGFTGLTANAIYYLSDTAGAITTTPGTKEVTVGIAISTTELLFMPRFNQMLTEDEQDALGGTKSVPNSTNKFVTNADTINADQVTVSQTTDDAVQPFGRADATGQANKIEQTFTALDNIVTGVVVRKEASTGTNTGDITIALYATDSNGDVTGSALATVTIPNATWEALTSNVDYLATFSAEYTGATPGQVYAFQYTCSTADNSNHPNIAKNSAGGYSGGTLKYNNTTDGWVDTSDDLYFKVIGSFDGRVQRATSTGGFQGKNVFPKTTTTGSSNAYLVTPDPAPAFLEDGQRFLIQANFTNTATATLNVNGLGAKTIITPGGNSLIGGEIKSGGSYELVYNGTNMVLVSLITEQGLAGVGKPLDLKNFWHFQYLFYVSTDVPSGNFWTLTNASFGQNVPSCAEYVASSDATNYIRTTTGIFVVQDGNFEELDFNDGKTVICEFGIQAKAIGTEQMGWGFTGGTNGQPFIDYDDQTVDAVCFTVDTSGNLYAHTGNAGAGHTEEQITGITLTNMNTYRIEFDGSEARFYVNGVLEKTISTNLPDSQVIYWGAGIQGNSSNNDGLLITAPWFAVEK